MFKQIAPCKNFLNYILFYRSLYVQDLLLSTLSNLRIAARPATPDPQPPQSEEVAVEVTEHNAEQALNDASTPVSVHAPNHKQDGGRGQFDKSGAAAKLKNAAMAGSGGGKPMAVGDRSRTAGSGGRQQQSQPQQQQQSVKTRELKNASMSAKESSDSTR